MLPGRSVHRQATVSPVSIATLVQLPLHRSGSVSVRWRRFSAVVFSACRCRERERLSETFSCAAACCLFIGTSALRAPPPPLSSPLEEKKEKKPPSLCAQALGGKKKNPSLM